MCLRCMRPESVCYCRHLTSIDTATRIVFLQHPRERDVAIGTARMANLCLPNSELHVGVDWQGSTKLTRAISDPTRPAALLYPGPEAIDVPENPPRGPITLVVVDGTWWQTKKLVRSNAVLRTLPRYAFRPPSPSEYRIRREPHQDCVSTIEALMHVLGVLEGDTDRFRPLLEPFRAMVDVQIACAERLHGARIRYKRSDQPKPPPIPTMLTERAGDLVCVVGEANAWPYRDAFRTVHPDVLVHWVARRISTGETFDVMASPRTPLAPNTSMHTQLTRDELDRAGTLQELFDGWKAFVRPTDVVCSWGRYATALFASSGGYLPPERVDLREVARTFKGAKVGTLEDFAASLGLEGLALVARGRAGIRMAKVEGVVRRFQTLARQRSGDEVSAYSVETSAPASAGATPVSIADPASTPVYPVE
jgi:DTW domain-containing protein YfiP